MNTLQSELLKKVITKKMKSRHGRIRALKSQLHELYQDPGLTNVIKIEHLENKLHSLENSNG